MICLESYIVIGCRKYNVNTYVLTRHAVVVVLTSI